MRYLPSRAVDDILLVAGLALGPAPIAPCRQEVCDDPDVVRENDGYVDRARWRGVLIDMRVRFLADHEICIDLKDHEHEGFPHLRGDLDFYREVYPPKKHLANLRGGSAQLCSPPCAAGVGEAGQSGGAGAPGTASSRRKDWPAVPVRNGPVRARPPPFSTLG